MTHVCFVFQQVAKSLQKQAIQVNSGHLSFTEAVFIYFIRCPNISYLIWLNQSPWKGGSLLPRGNRILVLKKIIH